jgi:uncharacterized phage infection (PIP) family protein YhgE
MKGGDPLGLSHFFSTIRDKVTKIFIPNQVLENILDLKTAIILIAISLLIISGVNLRLCRGTRRV